jgi:acyl carrier protein
MMQQVLRIVSDVLGEPLERLNGASSPDTVEKWDSLNHMSLVLALEEEFGVQFTDDQIMQLLSVDAIVAALTAQLPPETHGAG